MILILLLLAGLATIVSNAGARHLVQPITSMSLARDFSRSDSDEDFFPIGPWTMTAFRSLRLGMSRADVIARLGTPFHAPSNPSDPSGIRYVLDFVYPDGWASVGIDETGVMLITAEGPYRDAQSYPLIQGSYARQVGAPIWIPPRSAEWPQGSD